MNSSWEVEKFQTVLYISSGFTFAVSLMSSKMYDMLGRYHISKADAFSTFSKNVAVLIYLR